ncbi:MAG: Xaa-Pro aminopeptidase [Bacteroidia bacterium]|nr:Xaa-Pro aminopeptidase [Bacteroidia bacterium]MCX7652164.1 Xaa-Pro aminopeptidase [Bacteroidia bacterium]MDW8416887.1 Xaa-Pro aminopeptidase [Bacteroidia bacterium]
MLRHPSLPSSFFQKSRSKLKAELPAGTAAIIFANEPLPGEADTTLPFQQNSNYLYLTGIETPGGLLWIYPDAPSEDAREVLFIQPPSPEKKLWEGWSYGIEEARERSGISEVRPLSEWNAFWRRMVNRVEAVALDFNEHERQTHGYFPSPAHRFARRLQQELPGHRIVRLAPILTRLRMVKADEEIALMREAIAITIEAYQTVLPLLQAGVMEYEIEAEVQRVFLRRRAVAAFPPIIGGGERACILHYTHNSQPIQAQTLVLVDIGARLGSHCADLTRTIPVGDISPQAEKYLRWIAEVNSYAQQQLKPGISIEAWYKSVSAFMSEGMKAHGILPHDAPPDAYKRYFPHGLGHFLGIDVHDVGSRYEPLPVGAVVTCEPGLYLPNEGIGIRIENDLLVTSNGCENLSAALPDLLGM